MNLTGLSATLSKDEVHDTVKQFLASKSIGIIDEDFEKPWGGYFVIEPKDLQKFVKEFFSEYTSLLENSQDLKPKILIVAPQTRLSWQYHYRRAEIWKIVRGPVGFIKSSDDTMSSPLRLHTSDTIEIAQEQRHRLLGAEDWGVVAEIWRHTDPQNPSTEDDIVRVEDDFGR